MLMIGDSLSSDMKGAVDSHIDACWISADQNMQTGLDITYRFNSLKEMAGELL